MLFLSLADVLKSVRIDGNTVAIASALIWRADSGVSHFVATRMVGRPEMLRAERVGGRSRMESSFMTSYSIRAPSMCGTMCPLILVGQLMRWLGFTSKCSRSSSINATTKGRLSTSRRMAVMLWVGAFDRRSARWMNDDLPTPSAPMTAMFTVSMVEVGEARDLSSPWPIKPDGDSRERVSRDGSQETDALSCRYIEALPIAAGLKTVAVPAPLSRASNVDWKDRVGGAVRERKVRPWGKDGVADSSGELSLLNQSLLGW